METFLLSLDDVYCGNTVRDYLYVIGSLLVCLVLLKFLAHRISDLLFRLISSRMKQTSISKETLHMLVAVPLRWFIVLITLFVCTSHIEFPEAWNMSPRSEFGLRMAVHRTYLLALTIIVAWIALRVVKFIGILLMERAALTESRTDDQLIPFLIEIVKIVVLAITGFITMGTVFKIDIAALLTGLGIGGLALALAAKESLENLLASFIIFFDKPFVLGDTVTVNGITGSVEKIGFRSTRIRTVEKSYLTIPNLQMVNNVLDNLSMRTSRRVKFSIGLTYDTTREQLQAIVADMQRYIDEHPYTNQESEIHFEEFGASSLDITVLYYINSLEYGTYLRIKEEINFEIMRIVKEHRAEFAFPTQTVHLEKAGAVN